MPTLSVAIYEIGTYGGNVHHWALFLDEEGAGQTIYQVTGDSMAFVFDEKRGTNPEKSRRFRNSILVTHIDRPADVQEVHRACRKQAIRNDIALWNCQQWVMDVLESLHEADVIDEYAYAEATENLEAIFDQ